MILALTRRLEAIGRADWTLTQARSMSAGAESFPPQLDFRRGIDSARGWAVQRPFKKYDPARPEWSWGAGLKCVTPKSFP